MISDIANVHAGTDDTFYIAAYCKTIA